MIKLLTTLALLALPVFSQVTTLKQATPNTPYLKPISSGDGAVLTDKGTYEYVDKVYDANGFTTFDTNGVYRTDFETTLTVTDTEAADADFALWERGVFVSGTNSYLVEYGSDTFTNLILSSIVDGVFTPIATNAYQGVTVSDKLVTAHQSGTNVVFQTWTGTTPTTVGTLTNGYSTYLSVNKLQYANGTYTFAKYPSISANLATIYSSSNLVDWAITSSNKPTPIVYNSAFYAIGIPYNTYTYTTNNTSVPQTNNFTIVSTNGLIISTNTYTIVTTNVVTSVSTNTTYVNNTFRSDNGRTWTAYNTVAASQYGIKSYKSAQDMYVRFDASSLLDGTTLYSDNDITYTSAGNTLYGGALPFNGRWYTSPGITTDFLNYTTVGYDTSYTAMIGITHDNYLITIDALTPAYQSMQLLKTKYLLTGNVNAAIETHNTNSVAHADIRSSVSNCLTLANMTDGTVTAIGDTASAIGPGAFAVGSGSTASGISTVAVGGSAYGDSSSVFGSGAYVFDSLRSGAFGYASSVIEMNDTYCVGEGTAVSNGWFHYRGKPVIMTDTGRVYGPTGEYATPEAMALKYDASNPSNFPTASEMTNYVESITVPGSIVYGYTNASAYDSTYATLSKAPNPTAQTFAFSGVTNNQYIGYGWLSDDEVETFRAGVYNVHYWMLWNARSNPNATFGTVVELYIWDDVGVATQEVEDASQQMHVYNVLDDRDGRIYVNSEIERPNGARALIKLKAVVSGGYNVGGTIYLGDGYQSFFEFPAPSGFYARSSELLEVSNPTPLALTTNMVLFPNKTSGPVTCSNQAFTVAISGTGYQTGRANAIYTEITWYTNGTSMIWPTNITWMASTNAPTFANGKRYQVFLSKIEDVGNWLGSVSGAFQ